MESKEIMRDIYHVTEVSQPGVEPVGVAELKIFLRITHDSEDGVLAGYIKAARMFCENYTGKAFIKRSYKVVFDQIKDVENVSLPRTPLVNVTTLDIYNLDDMKTTIEANQYNVDTTAGRLCMKQGVAMSLPARKNRVAEIEFVAGYGDTAEDVPESIRQAVLMKATQLYEDRGDVPVTMPFDMIASLLRPYKTMGVS